MRGHMRTTPLACVKWTRCPPRDPSSVRNCDWLAGRCAFEPELPLLSPLLPYFVAVASPSWATARRTRIQLLLPPFGVYGVGRLHAEELCNMAGHIIPAYAFDNAALILSHSLHHKECLDVL